MSRLCLVVLLALTACLTPERRAMVLDAPLELRPAADALRGVALESLVVRASRTAADLPLTTGLVRAVAREASRSVVSIYTRTQTPARLRLIPFAFMPGFRVTLPGEALGSGFFVHPSGLILSNQHVVEDATEVWALTAADEELRLRVLALDPTFDLALLQVIGPARSFPALPMGDSGEVTLGETVLAIGNPLGLGHTVTMGIVSQTDRDLARRAEDQDLRRPRFLQTDSAINPGSSGGPLLTLTGAWIGVNTAQASGAQGIGFSVPSAQALEFLRAVSSGGWPGQPRDDGP